MRCRRLPSTIVNPWEVSVKKYLRDVRRDYAPTTYRTTERALRAIGKGFQELKGEKKIGRIDPGKLRLEDIQAYVRWMDTHSTRHGSGLRPSTQNHYLDQLKNFMRWCRNPAWDSIGTRRYVRLPHKVIPQIKSLQEATLKTILRELEGAQDWSGIVAHFMVSMYGYSGLRRSELRCARIQDLDTKNWMIIVTHPKGEGVWSSDECAPVLPPARATVIDFLRKRRNYLDFYGVVECEPLVPRVYRDGHAGYWTDGMWGKVKGDAESRSGFDFSIQELRATFAQMCKDRGAGIESVSRALRHRTCRTTELYYARIRPDQAFRELEQLFSELHRHSRSHNRLSNDPL